MITNVPNRLDGWEDGFKVPVEFSSTTMIAITKKQMTSAARREIVQAVSSAVMNVCRYPTAKQIDVVASKIVASIGVKDTFGVGYVSI